MKKLYFEDCESDTCHEKAHFDNLMKFNKVEEMEVYEAVPCIIGDGYFWCTEHSFCGDDSRDTCGKQCDEYDPRNGRSGRCRFHNIWLYDHGNKITLRREK